MNIVIEEPKKSVTIVRPAGLIYLSCAFYFREQLVEQAKKGVTLIVDLKEVSFMDSSGLGALISAFKESKKSGGDLRLANANEQLNHILKISALNRVLSLYNSLEEALSGIK